MATSIENYVIVILTYKYYVFQMMGSASMQMVFCPRWWRLWGCRQTIVCLHPHNQLHQRVYLIVYLNLSIYLILLYQAPDMKSLWRNRGIQACSDCMGVAYAANHFQRRKKQTMQSFNSHWLDSDLSLKSCTYVSLHVDPVSDMNQWHRLLYTIQLIDH